MNGPESEFNRAKAFINTANTVVVSPDYTLSVEAPYPGALNDSYDTLVWMKENASEIGMNPNQVFVGGGSAGGGLAAATTLYARDHKEINVAFQMPLYPMINDKMDTPSAVNNHGFLWDSERNRIAWREYLGDLYMTDNVPKYAAPTRETDFSNLPPTFTFVGTLDPFYDDTINYVNRLKEDGVKVEFHEIEGAYHGFDNVVPKATISKEAQKKMLEAFKFATENYYAKQN